MLTVIKGEGMNTRKQPNIRAALSVAWGAETVAARRMTAIAEATPDARIRARLMVLAAFCRAHASRLLARCASLGRGPLPVPPEEVAIGKDIVRELRHESAVANDAARRYQELAETCRQHCDLSSAWVCELNRTEEEGRSRELLALAEALTLRPGSEQATVAAPPAAPGASVPDKKTEVKKRLAHKWILPTDAEYDLVRRVFGAEHMGFIRKCGHCGCFRRIDAIRNTRMYMPKWGSWSNAKATAPKCIEPKKEA